MANNYLQFSFLVPLKTKKERTWLTKFLTDRPVGFWTLNQIEDCEDVEDREVGFRHEFSDDGVVIYAMENGDTEQVIQILKRFLKESGTKLTHVGFTYAYTCSSPRPDNFGGGAILVRKAGKVDYIDANEWLAGKLA